MSIPQVTVLLPVFNASLYLREAVDSILDQTFKHFELLIINDGSKDDSAAILSSYTDSRIRIINHDKNKGLIKTLNEGLQIAKGKYIIRMDADDVSVHNRIEMQVKFMEANTDIVLAGAWFKDIDGKIKVAKTPTKYEALKSQLFFSCALAHPTIIIRKNIFIENNLFYNSEFPHAEDYELWVRVSRLFKVANIPEVLLNYRFHEGQVSKEHNKTQRDSMHRCHQLQLNELGIEPTADELKTHYAIANLFFIPDKDFVVAAEKWLLKIVTSNNDAKVFSQSFFKKIIGDYWYNICSTLYEQGFDTRKVFTQSALVKTECVSSALQLKFRVKYHLGLKAIVQERRR